VIAVQNQYGCGIPVPKSTNSEMNRLWRAFLRRFDLEHTFGVPQANPGLDPAADPHTRPGRPLDLDHRGRPHPTSTGTPPHQRSASTMGETSHRASPAHPRPHPPRISEPPTEDHPSSQRTKTLTTRPRTPTRLQKPPARPPTRRRQERHHHAHQSQDRLNNKLRKRPNPQTVDAGPRRPAHPVADLPKGRSAVVCIVIRAGDTSRATAQRPIAAALAMRMFGMVRPCGNRYR
jgi:hypothetical protein